MSSSPSACRRHAPSSRTPRRTARPGTSNPKSVVQADKLGKSGIERDGAREGSAMLDGAVFEGAAAQKMVTELAALLCR